MDVQLVRFYLRHSAAATPESLLRDAVVLADPGAVELLKFVLSLRVNRRSRRTLRAVTAAYRKPKQERWLKTLREQLFNMYRLCLDGMSDPELFSDGNSLCSFTPCSYVLSGKRETAVLLVLLLFLSACRHHYNDVTVKHDSP
jgi:hypothetical protein